MSADDPLAQIKQTYFEECSELAGELERGLMAIDAGERDPEVVNSVFRAVHSIKGGAGAFGFDALVRFSHAFESVLDDLRSGVRVPDAALAKTMLAASDLLADLVREARGETVIDPARSDAIIARLNGADEAVATSAAPAASPAADPFDFDPFALDPLPSETSAPAEPEPDPASRYLVRLRPNAAQYARATEPAILLREVGELGEASVSLEVHDLPLLDELDVDRPHLSWAVTLATTASEDAIADIFSFIEEDAFDIEPLSVAPATIEAPAPVQAPASALPDAGLLAALAAVAAQASAMQAAKAAIEPEPTAPVAAVAPSPAVPAPAPEERTPPSVPAPSGAAPAGPGQQSIRVELERIDKLVDLVGELVINQAMLAQRISDSEFGRVSAVVKGLEELEHLTRDLQESVMAIRAQPVRSVFQRVPRLVREVAGMCGKQVRLVTEGEGTEVDKTVIERLSDPITHMIRNAIDHGLESTPKRLAAGKPAEGVVRLSAAHRSGRIIIEVSDDGGGIDRERVRAIAVSKNLIQPEAPLSDEEIDNLIFLPGFSTAAEVSNISGRGVGMDVVRSSIVALGGRIAITSRPGLGSTFSLSLPLTLAVLDGMVVTVAGETLVVPLTSVIETLQPRAAHLRYLGPDAPLVQMRDTYVPLLDVGRRLGYRTEPLLPTSGVLLLVEVANGHRMALLVDAIQGQRQVVIKSLEANYQAVDGIAAATILGDGRIALILDVDAVAAPPGRSDFPSFDAGPLAFAV